MAMIQQSESEVDYRDPNAIAVMAVDNLPCELPKDASEGFGEIFVKAIIPSFFNADAFGILERSRMTQNGKLTAAFSYLQAYVRWNRIESKKPIQMDRLSVKNNVKVKVRRF